MDDILDYKQCLCGKMIISDKIMCGECEVDMNTSHNAIDQSISENHPEFCGCYYCGEAE